MELGRAEKDHSQPEAVKQEIIELKAIQLNHIKN